MTDKKEQVECLLLAPDPAGALDRAAQSGVLRELLPEIDDLRQMDPRGRHKDVYLHSLQVLRNAVALETNGPDLELRLGALFHDAGKPPTRAFKGKKVTFLQHETVGAQMTRARLRSLGYDKATIKVVGRLVALHMRLHGFGEAGWTDSAVRRLLTDAGSDIDRLLVVMRSDVTSKRGPRQKAMSRMYDQFEARVRQVRAADAEASLRPDLTGEDVMDILNLKPGPEVGRAMRFLLQMRKDEGPLGKEEATSRLLAWNEAQK